MRTNTRAPRPAGETAPRPPRRRVPPITAAAIASSNRVPPPVPTETEKSREALTIPPVGANNPLIDSTAIRIAATGTPAQRAASELPPIAYRLEPTTVRRLTPPHTT